MRRYAARRDQNEPDIVEALEAIGCDVLKATDVDLIVGRHGVNYLIEVKRPKRATESRLRPIQKRLRDSWKGQYAIVSTPLEALKAIGAQVTFEGVK